MVNHGSHLEQVLIAAAASHKSLGTVQGDDLARFLRIKASIFVAYIPHSLTLTSGYNMVFYGFLG